MSWVSFLIRKSSNFISYSDAFLLSYFSKSSVIILRSSVTGRTSEIILSAATSVAILGMKLIPSRFSKPQEQTESVFRFGSSSLRTLKIDKNIWKMNWKLCNTFPRPLGIKIPEIESHAKESLRIRTHFCLLINF